MNVPDPNIKMIYAKNSSLCPQDEKACSGIEPETRLRCGTNPSHVPRDTPVPPRNRVYSPAQRLNILNCIDFDFRLEMQRDVGNGLSAPRKSLPSKYLYDERGSVLFDEICLLPEYYPTRTEMNLIDRYRRHIMNFFARDGGNLVEIGSGSDLKIRRLLHAVPPDRLKSIRYVPMDISESGLLRSARSLLSRFEGLSIFGIIGDFLRSMEHLPKTRKLITFFGSSIGNFPDDQAAAFLKRLARNMEGHDRLIIGMDMLKPVRVMEAAYNDQSGVTAEFNLNVLNHINHRMGADFQEGDFHHKAFFDQSRELIEMHLCARRDVRAYIGDIRMPVSLAQGETIHTEISRKYSRESIENLFFQAGLHISSWYTDPKKWFSLIELKPSQG